MAIPLVQGYIVPGFMAVETLILILLICCIRRQGSVGFVKATVTRMLGDNALVDHQVCMCKCHETAKLF